MPLDCVNSGNYQIANPRSNPAPRPSQLEIETGPGQPPVFPLVESIQARGTVRHVLLHLVGFNQEIHRQYALAEVPLVDLALEHQLVEVLQLRQREFPRQQLEADRLIAELSTQSLQSELQDLRVVEGEARRIVHAEPCRVTRVSRGLHVVIAQSDQRVIRYRHYPFPRITIDRTERIQLFKENPREPGFLFELASCRVLERLIHADETARQRPLPFERSQGALNQQHLQILVIQAEDDTVDGECRAGVIVGVSHATSIRCYGVMM